MTQLIGQSQMRSCICMVKFTYPPLSCREVLKHSETPKSFCICRIDRCFPSMSFNYSVTIFENDRVLAKNKVSKSCKQICNNMQINSLSCLPNLIANNKHKPNWMISFLKCYGHTYFFSLDMIYPKRIMLNHLVL